MGEINQLTYYNYLVTSMDTLVTLNKEGNESSEASINFYGICYFARGGNFSESDVKSHYTQKGLRLDGNTNCFIISLIVVR